MTFTDIPFQPTFEEYGKKIRIESYGSMTDTIKNLFNEAVKQVRPKAMYKENYIDEKKDGRVVIAGALFKSNVLRRNLDTVERVFCYVATCGTELEGFCLDPSDFMEQYLVDELKEMALRAALDYLRKHIKEEYKISKIATMNPGSGDADVWPIDQQRELFSLLGDVYGILGVTLTDSCLMTPNKTVSGIYFPSEVNFESCQECRRENCPSRRVPYAGERSMRL